jgi:hypothetical protein
MKNRTRRTKRIARKQRKPRPAKRRLVPRRSRQIIRTAPRTAKQYFAMSRESQDLWDHIVQVPARMRSGNVSLPKAAREFGVRPYLVRHLASAAFRKLPNGRYVTKAVDRLLRILPIPSKKGLIEIALRDSRQASLISEYWSAVDRYLSTGDASGLNKLKRIRIIDASGKRVRLLTDLDELRRQASAGVLRFESLYGRTS